MRSGSLVVGERICRAANHRGFHGHRQGRQQPDGGLPPDRRAARLGRKPRRGGRRGRLRGRLHRCLALELGLLVTEHRRIPLAARGFVGLANGQIGPHRGPPGCAVGRAGVSLVGPARVDSLLAQLKPRGLQPLGPADQPDQIGLLRPQRWLAAARQRRVRLEQWRR